MNVRPLVVFIATLWSSVAVTADTIRPPHERFAEAGTSEIPDFQRHVVPLLGRLGCNGRACHGSFQGQGGFRLSLFGYDFRADHEALTEAIGDDGQRRANLRQPHKSLILQKPTLQLDHEGDQRFSAGSWPYHLLLRWIEEGAKPVVPQQRLARLVVEPEELTFRHAGQSAPLRIVAEWADGSREEVTCLCRFETGDETIASIDVDGRVKAIGPGDTQVVAFYDNGVATVPVLLPVTNRAGSDYPPIAAPTMVDQLVVAKLRKLGIIPSEQCSDAEFLRRASIDLTGTLPTPDEIERFLADSSTDKRVRKVDELLESPAYAAWWANKLCDITGNSRFRQSEEPIGDQLAVQWYSWIYHRVAQNMPYDQLVEGIVLATSQPAGQSYDDYAAEMSSYLCEQNPRNFALRPTLPHYWTRRTVEKPEEKALSLAHSFLGLRLQCAQCHKHPYDQWTQDDFTQFTSFFTGFEYGIPADAQATAKQLARASGQRTDGRYPLLVTQEAAALAKSGKTVAWRALYFDAPATKSDRHLKLLGQQVHLSNGQDPRDAIMRWMREPDNPYFARAFVNRVWANYFHIGLIDPVDDLNLANPPSNPELLNYLADGFIEHAYDMKWLHREITRSDTYQRSWRPNETNQHDRRNFSRAIPRRLEAEVIYDALKQATASDAELIAMREQLEQRAIGHLSTRMAGTYAQKVFGKPDRLIACDCERTNTPALLQAIFMQNDPLIQIRLREGGWFHQIAESLVSRAEDSKPDVAQLVRSAYLRTVSRPPAGEESLRAQQYVWDSETPVSGLRDLLWALVNSKEFLLNH